MKTFLKITVKILLTLCIFVGGWGVLTPYFRQEKNEEGDLFRNLPSKSIDVLAIGSSHIQYAFNPAVLYAHTGYYSYVLGSSCQPFYMSYSMLKEALKTQQPEVVIVDVFTLLQQSEVCYADGMYYKAMLEMTGVTKIEAGSLIPDQNLGLQYTFDLLMNHSNWKYMDFSDFDSIKSVAKKESGFNTSLGYVAQFPEQFEYLPLITYEPEKMELSEEIKKQIDLLIELCESNAIKLVFIKTPYIIDQEDTNTLEAIWDYVSSAGCQYYDFIQMSADLEWFIGMDGDTWHNNTWGANIVTTYLAKELDGTLKGHRANPKLDALYNQAERVTAQYLMNSQNINIYHLLEDFPYYPITMIIKYTGGTFPIGEYENGLLQQTGINKDFLIDPENSYYAIIDQGKVINESTIPFETTIHGKNIEVKESGILIDGVSFDDSPGQMEIYICDLDRDWVNPIGIEPSVYGFWKKGCYSWDCGN